MTRIKSDPEHLDNKQGGGRRKQSKPIRVFFEDGEGEGGKLPPGAETNSHNEGLIEDMPRSVCEMEVEDNTLQCDLCNESFTSQTALMDHVQKTHTVGDENAQDSFPTKYHQLGMELSQNEPVTNGDGEPQQNNIPNIENYSDSQGVPCNGSKNRIFHKNAYCELCDREFCNKYFLKTHRANKHGITEDDCSSPQAADADMPRLTQPSEPVFPVTSPAIVSEKQMIPSQQAIMPKPPMEFTPHSIHQIASLNPPATPPKNSNIMSTPTKPMGKSMGGKPTPDMEDYCEMCQKHFCNKYYLKKHKQDVHGIMPEPSPSSTGKRGRPPMSGQLSSMPLMGNAPMSLPSSTLANLVMPQVSSTMSNGSANIPGLGNVMLINPFAPPVLIQAPQMMGGLHQGFHPQMGSMPQMPQPAAPASESPKSSASSNTTNVSSANLPINNEALRSMGVLNAEAYCELCRKEFCNKYFLRIHKANKHGIFTDEGLSPPAGSQGQSGLPVLNVPAVPNAGDLPPGTINITPTNDHESQATPEEGKMERSPVSGEREVEKGEIRQHGLPEETCKICNKEFPTIYSLRIHLINAHGLTTPEFDLMTPKGSKLALEKQSSMQSNNTMFGNMIAAKLADRVMCDICNKEVCNKYFLKTHKVKVHGLDPAVVEREINMMVSRESPAKNKVGMPGMPGCRSPPSDSSNQGSDVPRPKDEDLLKMGIDPEAYCEICKKEFCSKYFLKTHKQNIHGIKSDNGPMPFNLMTSTSEGMFFPSTNNNNKVMSSGNTSPVSLPDSDKSKDSLQRVNCELCNKELCNKYFLRTHMLNKHGINMDFAPIGNPFLPGFSGMPFLPGMDKLDMPMNFLNQSFMARMHEEMSQPLDLKKPSMSPTKMLENGTKSVFSAGLVPSAWHMPSNAKKEGQMNLSLQKCDLCGLQFGEKVTLQMHMIQDHPQEVTVSRKLEDKSNIIGNIALNLKKKYQKNRRIRGRKHKAFGSVQNGSGVHKKRVRCAYCKVRFNSRAECLLHIRCFHPKAKRRNSSVPAAIKAVPLPNGIDNNCKLVMQPFCMDGQGQFAPATVYLPVYEKVDCPMTVTFTLKPKPMEQ